MPDGYKLRVRIGNAEFEAEGAEETVREQFAEFQRLLAQPVAPAVFKKGPDTPVTDSDGRVLTEQPADLQVFDRLFSVDEKSGRRMVSLRFLPQGDDRDWVAMLLILLAGKRVLGEDRVQVTTLKGMLERSGVTVDRVDRIAEKPRKGGFVLKGGKAKGSTYALTNTGQARAEQELQHMLSQM